MVEKRAYPLEVSVLPRIRRIGRIGFWRKENKKFVAFPGLTPLQPGGDVHPCKQACLTELPHPSGLPLADGKLQSKIAAVGSTKRLPWSHNDILRLVKAPPLSSGVLPSRQQYHIGVYPGTPPSSVYQVTHGTALQAAVSNVGLSWHTSSVGVPGYSWYCPPGSGVLCAAIYPNEDELSHHQNPVYTPVPGG